MVQPDGKTQRYKLTEQERQLCLEAQLSTHHALRLWRAEQRDGGGGAKPKKLKKAIRKKPSKHTTPAMGIRSSKGMAPLVQTEERMERAEAASEAKDTTEAKDMTEAKDTAEAKDTPVAQVTAHETEVAEVEEVMADIVTAIAVGGQTNPRKRRRALLQDDALHESEF
ncbi:hypothetical protein PI124_g9152 [Phytophthora idaei]|nr:hypothetical protein PI124_g9152 [Phytophthora idaei]